MPESDQRSSDRGARDGPARGPDPPGLLLRHARPGPRQARASSSARGGSRARATTRSSSCGPSCRTSSRGAARLDRSFRVEVDAMPGGFVCSGTMKGTLDPTAPGPVSRRAPPAKLFSKEQRAFYAAHARGSTSTSLAVLGPIFVLKADSRRRSSAAGWSPRCGSTRTARRSWSSRRAARDARGVPGRRRGAGVPCGARGRCLGRAGDEDPQGAPVLREGPEGRAEPRPRPSPSRDRPPLGVADLRRRLRRGESGSWPRSRPSGSQESDEIYLLSVAERRVGEGA